MRHHKVVKKLDRNRAGRTALYRSLAISLIMHERIRTTVAKAKAFRPKIERLVTKARRALPISQRLMMQELQHEAAATKLVKEIAPRYRQRSGGYTRIIKAMPRRGDGAAMAYIEFVK